MPTCQKSSTGSEVTVRYFFVMHPEEELTSAAATGNTERLKMLLQNGANVNGVNSFQRAPLQVGFVFVINVAVFCCPKF